ncbi:MAG: helicase-related protein [Candidatus Azotimanducaceae bacterium WSBS_2022_MAG_OTU7]
MEVDAEKLASALSLGSEWLGADSAILKCLKLGIALHHGALPTAFRKEIERLLREGILRVTISSPTLAQGLNLSATVVVMRSLHRNGKPINSSEFRNVVGRVGRAHVDMEGLALFPMFDDIGKRRRKWKALVSDLSRKDMKSGLALLVYTLLKRMASRVGGDRARLLEYVTNNAVAWSFPEIENEGQKTRERAITDWENNLASLDSAILSLLGENDIPDNEVETALDSILQSLLWHRRLLRQSEQIQQLLKAGLNSRSHWIWSNSTGAQRKGYFLASVGLATGHALDAISAEVNTLLVTANAAIAEGNTEGAITSITDFAEKVFLIEPFTPDFWSENWKEILRCWLSGDPLTDIPNGNPAETLRFVEGGLIYHLPWAMEAVRVRALANAETIGALPIDSYELGLAVSAIETGTLNGAVSVLIKAGFGSRLAAIKIISDTAATFSSSQELKRWLQSAVAITWDAQPNWPTAETSQMWMEFVANFAPAAEVTWAERLYLAGVTWNSTPPLSAMPVRVCIWEGKNLVLSADGTELGTLLSTLNPKKLGLIRASVSRKLGKVNISYLGPDDLWLQP